MILSGFNLIVNEPTLSLERSLEVFPLARQAGLYNTLRAHLLPKLWYNTGPARIAASAELQRHTRRSLPPLRAGNPGKG